MDEGKKLVADILEKGGHVAIESVKATGGGHGFQAAKFQLGRMTHVAAADSWPEALIRLAKQFDRPGP